MFADPIKIRYRNIRKELSAYAVLDSCSRGTFKRKYIVQTTEHSGYGRQISLKSLNKSQFEVSFTVENSEIARSCYKGNDSKMAVPTKD